MSKISVMILRHEKVKKGATYEDYIYGKIGEEEFKASFWYPSQRSTKGSWRVWSYKFTNAEKRAIGKSCKEYCKQRNIGKGHYF